MRPAELQERLAEHFDKEGVDRSYVHFILQHVERPDQQWRNCCHSSCDPCVERLGRLVDRARQILDVAPPR
ncbi:MAG: hypothetical protein NXI31_17515 [bacterium]|nr:hypothetical protein [bacterium]